MEVCKVGRACDCVGVRVLRKRASEEGMGIDPGAYSAAHCHQEPQNAPGNGALSLTETPKT